MLQETTANLEPEKLPSTSMNETIPDAAAEQSASNTSLSKSACAGTTKEVSNEGGQVQATTDDPIASNSESKCVVAQASNEIVYSQIPPMQLSFKSAPDYSRIKEANDN